MSHDENIPDWNGSAPVDPAEAQFDLLGDLGLIEHGSFGSVLMAAFGDAAGRDVHFYLDQMAGVVLLPPELL
jgi:hypothetical protein